MALFLVRHGRTASNASGLLLGRADPPLDELGARQAAAIAVELAPDRVISSPLGRARQTASAFGGDVEVDERWIELDYGDWDGRPLGEIGAAAWARWQGEIDFAPPGGESLVTLGARVRSACDDLRDAAVTQDIVVVTHVSPLKAAVAWALGVGDEISWRLHVSPGSITRISIRPHGPVLLSFDEKAHLPD